MAFDWIKLEHVTPDKPEIVRLAELLKIDHDAAFGKCVRFWIWCDQQTLAGDEIPVNASFIDRLTNCPGFSARLLDVGWLKRGRKGSFSVPNFDRHNGQTAKVRALTKDRVQRSRNGRHVTKSAPDQDPDPDPDLDGEENTKPNTKPMRAAARRNAPSAPPADGLVGVYKDSISTEDLQDAAKTLEIAASLIGRSLSDAEKVGVLSIAARAVDVGDNPGGFFRKVVTDPKREHWKNPNQQQENQARRRLASLQQSKPDSTKRIGIVMEMAKGGSQ